MLALVLTNLGILLGAMVLLWILSLRLRDASIVDIAWGLAFVLVAWTTRAQLSAPSPTSLVLPIATTLWGLRLAIYLARRNLGHGEDKRYAAMRAARPTTFWWWSLFAVFGFQGVLCIVVSLPIQIGQYATDGQSANFGILTTVGLGLFAFGLVFEAVADWQLARFKADPANRRSVMDRGLWRYSRHPNYFGEAVLWWGFWLAAAAAPEALWTAVGPATITFLLLRVSGVVMLEKTIGERRPEYAEYIRRTNAFVPGPRRP